MFYCESRIIMKEESHAKLKVGKYLFKQQDQKLFQNTANLFLAQSHTDETEVFVIAKIAYH